jgi:hypothetical protein
VLSVNEYDESYIDACRSKMNEQLAAYEALVATAGDQSFHAAVEAFEPAFFNHLVLVLDNYFVHRSRTLEGKDGNPLNEVRLLCNSILRNDNVLCADKTIRFKPEASVLKLQVGEEIRLDQADFRLIFGAFFAEIEKKYR